MAAAVKRNMIRWILKFLVCANILSWQTGYTAELSIPANTLIDLDMAEIAMPGTVTIDTSGALQVSTGTITVSDNGNWSNSGTFTSGSGVVRFTGTSHSISGETTFYNLNCQIPGGTVVFEANKTQTISNSLTLKGAANASNYLSLRSSSDGTQWKIYPPSTREIDYVDLKDSNNTTNNYINISNWTNSGNNSYWGTAPDGGGDGGGGGGGGSTLTVSSISPSSGAPNVSVNTTVSATFNMSVNGSTVTTESFKISSDSGDVSGTVATDGSKITFTLSASLSYGTQYTATITTKVQAANAAGTSLDSNYSWSFTTASAPAASSPTPSASPSPTSAATGVPAPTATPQSSPVPSPSPTTPGVSGALQLSKTIAYLSGDTVVVTVADADRDANTTSEDTLTTAIRVTALNYYAGGDLMLDMKETAADSGTFLATIKTGTTTTGGADSGTRSNIGTFKTVQGGTATVVYTDTNPSASTTTKTLAFSSSDATLAFDRSSYTIGEYAAVTHVDAEENTDHTQEETLLSHAVIETSSINRAWMKLTETGADTGTFKGSILVSGEATLDNERIQASGGDTLTVGCSDEINTSGASRWVTAVSRVVSTVTTPLPTPTATPLPSPTSTPTPLYTSSISGSVVDTKGSPVVSATVSIRDKGTEDSKETTTDGNGLFKFTGLAAGEYEVSARKDSSKSTKKRVTLEDGENKELTITVYTKGWKYNPANDHFYKVIKGGTWPRSNRMAGKRGAQLVCIEDKKEQQWLVKKFGGSTLYWIGLTDKGKEGVWKWVNGENASYTNWFGNEPNNTGSGEDYAVMNWQSPGKWNDLGLQSGQESGVVHAIIEAGDGE